MEGRKGRLVRSLKLRLCLILCIIGIFFTAVVSTRSYSKTLDGARLYIDEEISQIADIIVAYNMPLPKRWSEPNFFDNSFFRNHSRHRNNDSLFLQPSLSDLFERHRDIIIAPLYTQPGETIFIPMNIEDGLYSILINDNRVRCYIATNRQGIRFVVARSLSIINDAVEQAFRDSLIEFLVLIGIYIPTVLVIMNLMFLPVRRLAFDIDKRRENDLRPLNAEKIPSELDVFIDALNRLFNKTSESLQNERRFIADAAHEMRTPLTALSLQAEAFKEKGLDDEQKEQLLELRQAIRRQRDLTTKLLNYARSQCSQPHDFQDIVVKSLFIEILEELGALADDKNIDFGIDGEVDSVIHSDKNILESILTNLCSNALKYTQENGQVDLSCEENSKEIIISVKDNGSGIPEDKLKLVFEPFYRVGGDTARVSGTGLGLAIVKSSAEELGAKVELSNVKEGGLLAKVILPKLK